MLQSKVCPYIELSIMVGTKKTSQYRKKRKGFFSGLRRQVVNQVEESDDTMDLQEVEVGPLTLTPIKSPDKANRSKEKIERNYPLHEKDSSIMLTRKRALSLGYDQRKRKRQKVTSTADQTSAHGFKLVQFDNLNCVLYNMAICSSCKSVKGKLILLQNDQHRSGLDEQLIIRCQNCSKSTFFRTSPMVKSGMGSSSEINSRCVQAGIETGIGLTNMQKLCIAFGLPFPLSHTAYNNMKFQTCYAILIIIQMYLMSVSQLMAHGRKGMAIQEQTQISYKKCKKLCGQSIITLFLERMRLLQFNTNSVQKAMIAGASVRKILLVIQILIIRINVCLLFLEMNCCQ